MKINDYLVNISVIWPQIPLIFRGNFDSKLHMSAIKVEMKNLRFGIDMKSGKASKCHQIHIGKYEEKCPTLKAQEINAEKVEEDLYVGDIISNDGKFTKNIKARYAKATGVTSQIMLMLKEISLEFHYFSIAMVYRNLLFINSVLVNAEVWYPISEKDIKDLIDADKILLRKIFEVPVSTPICLLFLESGEIPIENILKSRRINYLYYLLNSPSGEMLSNVFKAQVRKPLKGDWVEIVKKDLEEFEIYESFEEISKNKEETFKKKVAKACRKYTFQKLMQEKEKLSKGTNLKYNNLTMQSYLTTNKLGLG